MSARKSSWGYGLSVAMGIALALAMGTPAQAQVKPGDFITADQANHVRDLGLARRLLQSQRGMTMRSSDPAIHWPPPYQGCDREVFGAGALSADLARWRATWRGSRFR